MIGSMLQVADHAVTSVIRRLEQLHLHLGRRVAVSDDQRHFIIEIERLEEQVASVRGAHPVDTYAAAELMKDLRRAKAQAHKLGFSRHAVQTVQARIAAAATSILVEVFQIDPDVIKEMSER